MFLADRPYQGPAVVFYILLIAVLNLGLGYVVATHLGRRYRALLAGELNLGPLEPVPPDAEDTPLPTEDSVQAVDEDEIDPATALIDELLQETAEYRALLDEANRIAGNDSEQLETSERGDLLHRLSEGTEAYIDQRQAHEDDFRSLIETEELRPRRDSLCSTWELQDAQLQQVSETADQLAAEPDCEEFWADFGQQIDNLLATTSDMDSLLGEAKTTLEGTPDLPEPSGDTAAPAATIEATVEQYSSTGTDLDACPCVALIDVDHVDRLNQRYGRGLIDRMLEAIHELVQVEERNDAAIRRIDNQRFALVFPNPDAQRAANIVERLRQTVGKTHFVCGDREIQATVSCAVGGPGPGDKLEALTERVESTLGEAKQYGRNRTFLHRGGFPVPIVPPTLTLDETRTHLDADESAPEPSESADDGDRSCN